MSVGVGGPRAAGALAWVLLPTLGAPLAAILGVASGLPALPPILAAACVYPSFALLLLRGRRGAAIAAALLWAASLSATFIVLTHRDPARTGAAILAGPAYRDEMLAYVRTGTGRETEPARFLPQHLLHLAGFAALTLVSGGLLGLVLGAILVGFMSYYVGSLTLGAAPLRGALLGWPPWAVLRVAAFVLLGAVLARPLLGRAAGRALPAAGERRILVAAAALLVLDAILKALLAPAWAEILRPCLPHALP